MKNILCVYSLWKGRDAFSWTKKNSKTRFWPGSKRRVEDLFLAVSFVLSVYAAHSEIIPDHYVPQGNIYKTINFDVKIIILRQGLIIETIL